MARIIKWKPLPEIIKQLQDGVQERIESTIRYIVEDTARSIKRIESNRLAAALLDGAGFDLELLEWDRGSMIDLELGFFPRTKAGKKLMAETIMKVRRTLDVRKLTQEGKDIASAEKKTIRVILKCEEFPGLRIIYVIKEPKSAPGGVKCRIVRRRVTQTELVCERE